MPVLKAINGHTGATGVMRYLTRGGRAAGCDFMNLSIDSRDGRAAIQYEGFDWASEMDATRRLHGNDAPYRGRQAITYRHYVLSPDPQDGIDMARLRSLALAWAERHFADFEVAIVYHEDNERGIPHAHIVVNNTNLENGRRLHIPDPKALNRDVQAMAKDAGLAHFDNRDAGGRTGQRVCMRRAEVQLAAEGKYSWVADIRSRVQVAKGAARSLPEFRALLAELGVEVSDNARTARNPDWIYSLVDQPSRRITAGKLGASYSREGVLDHLGQGCLLDEAGGRRIAEIARRAVTVGDLAQLRRLSEAVALIERGEIDSMVALDAYMRSPPRRLSWSDMTADQESGARELIEQEGMLPFRVPRSAIVPVSSAEAYARTRPQRRSEAAKDIDQARQRDFSDSAEERSCAREERER